MYPYTINKQYKFCQKNCIRVYVTSVGHNQNSTKNKPKSQIIIKN